jgi:hypothetical protein
MRDPVTGRFVENPASEAAAARAAPPPERVHGNPWPGPKETVLYRLEDEKTGELLKHGVTSDPAHRYTAKEMEG